MTFQRPTKQVATVIGKNYLDPNNKYLYISFLVENKHLMEPLPGQFVSLQVAQNTYRSYSICASNIKNGVFSIVAAVAHDGIGSTYLKSLECGHAIDFIGPAGRFILSPLSMNTNIVFVSTGTGIAPFMTMLDTLLQFDYKHKVTFIHGARYEHELLFLEEIETYSKSIDNFESILCVSSSDKRVTSVLPISSNVHYYLCGNPNMVEDAKSLLAQNNIGADCIFTEKFTHAKQIKS
ncbi:MAG: FAD-dependent oxidoreductase [Patescibacteria group bacterium]